MKTVKIRAICNCQGSNVKIIYVKKIIKIEYSLAQAVEMIFRTSSFD